MLGISADAVLGLRRPGAEQGIRAAWPHQALGSSTSPLLLPRFFISPVALWGPLGSPAALVHTLPT